MFLTYAGNPALGKQPLYVGLCYSRKQRESSVAPVKNLCSSENEIVDWQAGETPCPVVLTITELLRPLVDGAP